MNFAVVPTKAAAVALEARCHSHMLATVPRYNAVRWSVIFEEENTNRCAVRVAAKVTAALTAQERAGRVEKINLKNGWRKPMNTLSQKEKKP